MLPLARLTNVNGDVPTVHAAVVTKLMATPTMVQPLVVDVKLPLVPLLAVAVTVACVPAIALCELSTSPTPVYQNASPPTMVSPVALSDIVCVPALAFVRTSSCVLCLLIHPG